MIGGGRPLLPEILDQTDRVGTKKSVMNSLILIGIKKANWYTKYTTLTCVQAGNENKGN